MKPRLLVITPVKHINGVPDKLEAFFDVCYMDDPSLDEILPLIHDFDAIFTNPNKSKIFIGNKLLDLARNLKVICTASTGTNHIDINCAEMKGIKVLSLTEEREIINKISSTAEHAFALTLASLRNIIISYNDVLKGRWDYEKFIGRQMDGLTIGVIGFGRLGNLYSNYCKALGSKVLAYDPYMKISQNGVKQVENFSELITNSDVISFHVHVTKETKNMVNNDWFTIMKPNVLLINTSRGEIINEENLISFLEKNRKARIATDVISDEIRNRKNNLLLNYAKSSQQVVITPHIGGMTKEAQEIAYNHAADLLREYIGNNSE